MPEQFHPELLLRDAASYEASCDSYPGRLGQRNCGTRKESQKFGK